MPLRRAGARHAPCWSTHAAVVYSCYFMVQNVLTGSEWESVGKRAVVIEWMPILPRGAPHAGVQGQGAASYRVRCSKGHELGRNPWGTDAQLY